MRSTTSVRWFGVFAVSSVILAASTIALTYREVYYNFDRGPFGRSLSLTPTIAGGLYGDGKGDRPGSSNLASPGESVGIWETWCLEDRHGGSLTDMANRVQPNDCVNFTSCAFCRWGTPAYWHIKEGLEINGTMFWTRNNGPFDCAPDNAGPWHADVQAADAYSVCVFVPASYVTLTDAKYASSNLDGYKLFQVANRHKISLVDDNDVKPGCYASQTVAGWLPTLDCSLFASSRGYASVDGNSGDIFCSGSQGSWQLNGHILGLGKVGWSTYDERHAPKNFARPWMGNELPVSSSRWLDRANNYEYRPETALHLQLTPSFGSLYLVGETTIYPQTWAQWMRTNSGVGHNQKSMAAVSLPAEATKVDVHTSAYALGQNKQWQAPAGHYSHDPVKRFWRGTGGFIQLVPVTLTASPTSIVGGSSYVTCTITIQQVSAEQQAMLSWGDQASKFRGVSHANSAKTVKASHGRQPRRCTVSMDRSNISSLSTTIENQEETIENQQETIADQQQTIERLQATIRELKAQHAEGSVHGAEGATNVPKSVPTQVLSHQVSVHVGVESGNRFIASDVPNGDGTVTQAGNRTVLPVSLSQSGGIARTDGTRESGGSVLEKVTLASLIIGAIGTISSAILGWYPLLKKRPASRRSRKMRTVSSLARRLRRQRV